MSVKCKLIGCPEWGAAKPKNGITTISASKRIIFHHTAGHHAEISLPKNESRAEAIKYAKAIQRMHMAPGGLGAPHGGIDSGHNFLVCRNGMILQGRWLTISAIQAGHMVSSAHCPNQNDQIGIEHEHLGSEPMTKAQREASARLMAWIADQYDLKRVLPVDPHSKYFATACPANLKADIPKIKARAQQILESEGHRFAV
jgi:hypothetical protein